MRLAEGALFHEHLFGEVIHDVRRLLPLGYKELAKRLRIKPERIQSFKTKGTAVKRSEFESLCALIGEAGDASLVAYLECKYPQIFAPPRKPVSPAGQSLFEWLGTRDQFNTDLYRKCIRDSQGRFLLMRRDDEGRMICALMRVRQPADPQSLPTFDTFRFETSGRKRTTQGFIFEYHGRVYTIGKLDSLQGMRFANLHIHEHRYRNDLFGIRLGILKGPGLTFASRIYAYQIKASARLVRSHPGILEKVLTPWHPQRDPGIAASIPGFAAIYDLLLPGALVDNGLTVPA